VFVQRSVRAATEAAYGTLPPLICVHCVVQGYVPVDTVLNLEACPWGDQYCPYGNRNRHRNTTIVR
jgi:hypothetical protein